MVGIAVTIENMKLQVSTIQIPTLGGSIANRPFGFDSGYNSLVVAISIMSMYLAPGSRGPSSNLLVVKHAIEIKGIFST